MFQRLMTAGQFVNPAIGCTGYKAETAGVNLRRATKAETLLLV